MSMEKDFQALIDGAKDKITVWERWNPETKEFQHNHIEDGWVEGDVPEPKCPESKGQQQWKKAKWRKTHTYLVDGVVQ